MFGSAKSAFGSAPTENGFGKFTNKATASSSGQSTFGKPATAFGASPTFGTQQPGPSLFGANEGQTQKNGLFGAASTSLAFGNTTTAQPAFGNTTTAQPAFGGFSQPEQNTSIFDAAQPAANTSSLFGTTNTSAFGVAVKTTKPTASLFGQPAMTSASGIAQAAPATSNVFGSAGKSAFGQPTAQAAAGTTGTSIAKYQPTIGTDTLINWGQQKNVSTKQHCITAMKEYETKSLEELRVEDYLANHKGPQPGSTSTSGFLGASQRAASGNCLFGATTQQSSGLFGQNAPAKAQNKSLFGNSGFGQHATSAFGSTGEQHQNSFLSKPFGASAPFALGATTNDATNKKKTKKKPFGQPNAPSLFGQQLAARGFGQTNAGFGGFGTTAGQQQQPNNTSSLLETTNTSAFGAAVKPSGLGGFGQTTTETTAPLFGQPVSTSASGLRSFGLAAAATSNVFDSGGKSAFGQPTPQAAAGTTGTHIAKYQPTIATDVIINGFQQQDVSTKQHCITAMKEYETKSLEELRVEDYLANHKGLQAGSTSTSGFLGATQPAAPGTCLFGATTQQSSSLFGQTAPAKAQNKSLFGNSAFVQPTTSVFGTSEQQHQNSFLSKPFGAPGPSAFGTTTNDATNPFGTKSAFGQPNAPTVFGEQLAAIAARAFGQTNVGFGGSGTTAGQQQQPTNTSSLLETTNTSAFNAAVKPSSLGGFGQIATQPTVSLFGQPVSTSASGFSSFRQAAPATLVAGTTGTSIAKYKPTIGTDTLVNCGQQKNVSTKQHCITAMKEYEAKSLEELRMEDYLANHKGPQACSTGTSEFSGAGFGGATSNNAQSGGLFDSKPTTGFLAAPAFGATAKAITGFSNFSMNNAAGGDGLFNSTLCKPTTSGFGGFSTQTSTAPLNFNAGFDKNSLFGNSAAKPGELFGNIMNNVGNANPGGGLFVGVNTSFGNGNNSSHGSSQCIVPSTQSPSGSKVKAISNALCKFEGLEEFVSSVESLSLKPNEKSLIISSSSSSNNNNNESNNDNKTTITTTTTIALIAITTKTEIKTTKN